MSDLDLRQEIAYAAARLIAEDGLDYSSAKKKAIKSLLGQKKSVPSDLLPDNNEIEDAVREYQALYLSDTQPQQLAHLRQVALEVMTLLQDFNPYLTGAVWTGTASEHSDIAIQCFTDSAKDVEIFLLNQKIDFEVGERPDFRGRGTVEALYFMWQREGVMVCVYDHIALRGALKPGHHGLAERGDRTAVTQLLGAQSSQGSLR